MQETQIAVVSGVDIKAVFSVLLRAVRVYTTLHCQTPHCTAHEVYRALGALRRGASYAVFVHHAARATIPAQSQAVHHARAEAHRRVALRLRSLVAAVSTTNGPLDIFCRWQASVAQSTGKHAGHHRGKHIAENWAPAGMFSP